MVIQSMYARHGVEPSKHTLNKFHSVRVEQIGLLNAQMQLRLLRARRQRKPHLVNAYCEDKRALPSHRRITPMGYEKFTKNNFLVLKTPLYTM